MKNAAFTLALTALVLPAVALAEEEGCYERTYSDAHLAANPTQGVAALRVLFYRSSEYDEFSIAVDVEMSAQGQAARDGGGPGSVPYATSKGAIMTLTRGLAKEIGPDIRVNGICPGMIDTDFHNIHTPDAGRRGFEAAAPMKRQGNVDDVANLVLFLACDDSAFITGTNVDLNGGMLFS